MSLAKQLVMEERRQAIPSAMQAAVYRGVNDVRLETVPVPQIGRGEILLRVHTCGICGTDLKKIATGSHSAPRIFGHETSGVIAAVGDGVCDFQPGDRVVVFHHIPCRDCYYCRHRTFAQCETYKKVGCTAGFEPSGGGLIRSAMDAVRPGGRVLLFAQTVHGEATIDPAAVCVDEKTLLGSYSASVELQEESVRFVMNHELDLEPLISHRFPLPSAVEALNLAAHPQAHSMKIVIQPGSSWEGRSD